MNKNKKHLESLYDNLYGKVVSVECRLSNREVFQICPCGDYTESFTFSYRGNSVNVTKFDWLLGEISEAQNNVKVRGFYEGGWDYFKFEIFEEMSLTPSAV